MKQQKFLMVDDTREINGYLEEGWEIISVTAQHVSVSTTYNSMERAGKFAVVIQRQNQN